MGTANITARFSYALPTGTQFNPVVANKQKMVLGQQTTGNVVTPASASWTAPTAVTLSTFEAKSSKKQVKLNWETGSELSVLGFNVWRSNARNGKYKLVNPKLVSAKDAGNVYGNRYGFQDKTTSSGKVYFYKLEVVGVNGTLEWSEIRQVRVP
jgi:hypothetical protein